jgi:hypothetical protein
MPKQLPARMRSRPMLWRMMAHLGIDPHGRWWHGAESALGGVLTRCMACPHTQACGAWLDNTATAARAPDFCPNALHFAACRPGQHVTCPEPECPEHRALQHAVTQALQIVAQATQRREFA